MPLPSKGQLARFALILTAYSNPLYAVPAIVTGGLIYQFVRDSEGDRAEDTELFFLLVPGAPILFPRLAWKVAHELVSHALRTDEERETMRKRDAIRAEALFILAIECWRHGISTNMRGGSNAPVLVARINDKTVEGYMRAVAEIARKYEPELPPDLLLARIRPNSFFDDDWKQRQSLSQARAA